MLPVYLKTGNAQPPADSVYYVVAANGTFLVRNTKLFTATTASAEVVGLERQRQEVRLHFPKIPRAVMERLIGFFRMVYLRWDGEAIAFLFYAPDRREFRVEIPPQTLPLFRSGECWRTEGRLEYASIARPEGFLKLGDAHSHRDSPAFFSSIDDRDDSEDGLRLVVGRLDRIRVQVRASFVANGCRFALPPQDVIETSPEPFSAVSPPEEWMRRVVCRYEPVVGTNEGRGVSDEH
jgi:hypothetical protein